jgi:S1-C subfamily serine protease
MRSRALLPAAFALLCACNAHAQTSARPPDPFVVAFRAVRPSVVLLRMRVPSDEPRHKGELEDAYGTGVVVRSGPWGSEILTDEHVIEDASNLRVLIEDQRNVPVRITVRDTDADLALLASKTPNLPVARLGNEHDVEAGMAVGIAGYPIPDAFEDEGLGTRISVYAGRVSSIRKDALELDLPVIPGESGGPVFDAQDGAVVAIAESRFDEERAIGFGIPLDVVKRFLQKHAHPISP